MQLSLRKFSKEYTESDDVVVPEPKELEVPDDAEEESTPVVDSKDEVVKDERPDKQPRLTYDDAWRAFSEEAALSEKGAFGQVSPAMTYYFNSLFKIYAAALRRYIPNLRKDEVQGEAYTMANDFIYSPKFMDFDPERNE